jgi:hypothetical protein
MYFRKKTSGDRAYLQSSKAVARARRCAARLAFTARLASQDEIWDFPFLAVVLPPFADADCFLGKQSDIVDMAWRMLGNKALPCEGTASQGYTTRNCAAFDKS